MLMSSIPAQHVAHVSPPRTTSSTKSLSLPALAVPQSPPLDVGCEVNPDCPVHKACFNRICRDPCVLNDPCGINAFCRVEAHQAVCRCPEGYLGNPRVECKLREYSLQLITALVVIIQLL